MPSALACIRAAVIAVAAAIAALPARAQGVAAQGIDLVARPNGALLTLDLMQEVAFETTVMSNPDRLVIDLPQTVIPANPRALVKAGPVKAYRYGLFFAGRSRIVIDLSEPALIEKIDFPAIDGRRRMSVAITRTDRARFDAAVQRDAARRAEASQQAATSRPAAGTGDQALPLVVIDPGHGGIDPGASAPGGDSEKSIVLDLSRTLAERLQKSGRMRVEMTRTDDTFVSLGDRVKFARDRKAALMLSIHADTLAYEPGVRGASIYTLSERASDAVSARLADSENKADQIAGVEAKEEADAIGDILFDLTKRETRVFSQTAARQIVATMQGSTGLHKHPLKSAGFRVLTAPDVPSVLIEAGYLSSQDDVKQMKSQEWRQSMADAIARAVEKFLDENATRSTNSTAKP